MNIFSSIILIDEKIFIRNGYSDHKNDAIRAVRRSDVNDTDAFH